MVHGPLRKLSLNRRCHWTKAWDESNMLGSILSEVVASHLYSSCMDCIQHLFDREFPSRNVDSVVSASCLSTSLGVSTSPTVIIVLLHGGVGSAHSVRCILANRVLCFKMVCSKPRLAEAKLCSYAELCSS